MNINVSNTNINVTNIINDPVMMSQGKSAALSQNEEVNTVMPSSTGMGSTLVSHSGMIDGTTDVANFENMLKEKAALVKDNLATLFNKLSITDARTMDEKEMGSIDDDEVEKTINVVEEIKIMLATYCEDYVPTGDIDVEDIKRVTGDAALAARVVKKFSTSNVPCTKDNVTEVMRGVEEYKSLKDIDDSTKRYLIRNELPPTINNIYIAQHSSSSISYEAVSDKDIESMTGQIKSIIVEAGFLDNEMNFENAKTILKEGSSLNKENLTNAEDIDNISLTKDEDTILDIVFKAFDNDASGVDALVANKPSIKEKAAENYSILNNSSAQDIIRLTNELKELTLANLSDKGGNTEYIKENEDRYISNYSILVKAQVSLSAGTFATMEKLNVPVKELTLSELTNRASDLSLENEYKDAINELRATPVNVLSQFTYTKSITVQGVIDAGYSYRFKAEAAMEAYETFGTQIRKDLGDSFNRAVDNSADNILKELKLEADVNNRAAVRILSFGQLEINEANVQKTASDYAVLSEIATGLAPDTLLDMIRNKMNPLTMEIGELKDFIKEKSSDESSDSFAKFLYKLETKSEISESERQDYIGMYKLLNTLNKDQGKTIAEVMKNGEELNLNNLMKAYVSRKHSGIDESLGENTEYSVGTSDISYYLKLFSDTQDIDKETMPDKYYEEQLDRVKESFEAEDSVIRILTDNDLAVTPRSVIAALDFKGNKIFRSLKEIDNVKLEKEIDELKDCIDDADSLKKGYDNIFQSVKEAKERIIQTRENVSYANLQTIDSAVHSAKLLRNLAKKKEYKIPIRTDSEVVTVNLKILDGKSQSGKMSVSFESSKTGKVSVNCKAENDRLDVFALCDNDEGRAYIESKKEAIISQINAAGFTECRMSIGKSDELPEVTGHGSETENTSTVRLYKAAKAFIINLVE